MHPSGRRTPAYPLPGPHCKVRPAQKSSKPRAGGSLETACLCTQHHHQPKAVMSPTLPMSIPKLPQPPPK